MISPAEQQTFREDFLSILKLCQRFDEDFTSSEILAEKNTELLLDYAGAFSRKYPGAKLVLKQDFYGELHPWLGIIKKDCAQEFVNLMEKCRYVKKVIIKNNIETQISGNYLKERLQSLFPKLHESDLFIEFSGKGMQEVLHVHYDKKLHIVLGDNATDPEQFEFKLCQDYFLSKDIGNEDLQVYENLFAGHTTSTPSDPQKISGHDYSCF